MPAAPDYNALHAARAAELLDPTGRRVLVVGCNRGEDCRYFVDFGAAEVHGVDVMDEIGRNFQHERVRYNQVSAERMPLPNDRFDLVYCFATMEHIPDIDAAFREMARVTRPGGFLYSVAAPLWNSRQGHHKGDLFAEPWIHLRMGRDEIVAFARANRIDAPGGIDGHVDYMLDDRFFNKVPARRYLEVCGSLPGMEVIRNDLECESASTLTPALRNELGAKGYDAEELLALTHTYIGRKRPFFPSDRSTRRTLQRWHAVEVALRCTGLVRRRHWREAAAVVRRAFSLSPSWPLTLVSVILHRIRAHWRG